MPKKPGDEPSLEQVVGEIRRIRLQRFFSLSDSDIEKLASTHEHAVGILYEIYYRYGDRMDDRIKTAIPIYLFSKEADFERVYRSLKDDGSNREEVLGKLAKRGRIPAYN
jgi:hypothetical protein